jgi:hypothetical protein
MRANLIRPRQPTQVAANRQPMDGITLDPPATGNRRRDKNRVFCQALSRKNTENNRSISSTDRELIQKRPLDTPEKPASPARCKVLDTDIGQTYEGGCKDGFAHGYGKAKGRDEYRGEFQKGEPHGFGVYEWGRGTSWEGDRYEGQWIHGDRTGKGKYIERGGALQEGQFVDGQLTGTFKIVTSDGINYNNYSLSGSSKPSEQAGCAKFSRAIRDFERKIDSGGPAVLWRIIRLTFPDHDLDMIVSQKQESREELARSSYASFLLENLLLEYRLPKDRLSEVLQGQLLNLSNPNLVSRPNIVNNLLVELEKHNECHVLVSQ